MNRLTRIYGLNHRHCLHELAGSMTPYPRQMLRQGYRLARWIVMYLAMDKRMITILRLGVITLQRAKVKDCDRHPPHYARVQVGKPGKVCLHAKGA